MRTWAVYFLIAFGIVSCSKEENIPFLEADRATISPDYYHNLAGHYVGTISEITFVNETTYVVNSQKPHELDVTEFEFDYVNLYNISGRVSSDALAEVSRLDDVAYIQMQESSIDEKLDIDTIYYNYYNGLYTKTNNYLEYYLSVKVGTNVITEVFQGTRN